MRATLAFCPLLLVAASVLSAAPAGTGTIRGTLTIQRKDGSPREDRSGAVVFVADVSADDRRARGAVRQQDKQFMPLVQVVPAGATVSFPNDDSVEHNVFSHSAIAEFDLGRYAKGQAKSVTFPKVGVAEVFCNIHKEMVSYLVVAPSPAYALTGTDGTFTITGVPPGHHKIKIWERFARPRMQDAEVDVVADSITTLDVSIAEHVEGEPAHKNKFGVEYPVNYR